MQFVPILQKLYSLSNVILLVIDLFSLVFRMVILNWQYMEERSVKGYFIRQNCQGLRS